MPRSPETRCPTKPKLLEKHFAVPRASLSLEPSHNDDIATISTGRREGEFVAANTIWENFEVQLGL
jgi:hypothetical protein